MTDNEFVSFIIDYRYEIIERFERMPFAEEVEQLWASAELAASEHPPQTEEEYLFEFLWYQLEDLIENHPYPKGIYIAAVIEAGLDFNKWEKVLQRGKV